MTPVLVCDLDGVIFDFDRGWIERHQQHFGAYGVSPEVGAPQRWDELHELGGFETRAGFWRWFFDTGGFEGLPVYPGAVEALWLAAERGWTIIYATNRPKPDHVSRLELAKARVPNHGDLRHLQHKHFISADLFIEDAPGNLVQMSQQTGAVVLRVEQPWNNVFYYPALKALPAVPSLAPETLLPWLEKIEAAQAPT